MRFLYCFIFSIFFFRPALAQIRYFYKGRNFGSEAEYNPINVILNGSFDIIQLDGHLRDIFDFPYSSSIKNVLHNLGDPFPVIRRYGWGKFLENEIFPIDFAQKGAQWWRNNYLGFNWAFQ